MYNYARINNIGNISQDDPLTMCLTETLDRKFQYGGSVGAHSGPRSAACQEYMSDRCAKKWDGFCEYFYQENGKNGPNNKKWPSAVNRSWESQFGFPTYLTLGDNLLKDTAEKKYCSILNCNVKQESMAPTIGNMSRVNRMYAQTTTGCVPMCQVTDVKSLDTDPVFNHMLDNPDASAPILINMCNVAKTTNTDLNGTKLGKVCNNYFSSIRQ